MHFLIILINDTPGVALKTCLSVGLCKNKVMTKIIFIFLSLISIVSCAGKPSQKKFTSSPTYNMIVTHKGSLDNPLGGDYKKGIKILGLSPAAKDAEAVYAKQGLTMIRFSSWTDLHGKDARREESLPGNRTAKISVIPGTGIQAPDKSVDYQRVANDYAEAFNRRMEVLSR
jgi:hypothetical protein